MDLVSGASAEPRLCLDCKRFGIDSIYVGPSFSIWCEMDQFEKINMEAVTEQQAERILGAAASCPHFEMVR